MRGADRQGPRPRAPIAARARAQGIAGRDAVLRARAGKSGDFESGIRMALQSILVSPRFVFRLEGGAGDRAGDGRATASPTRIWPRGCRSSSGARGPDAELIKAAGSRPAARPAPASRSRCGACSPTSDPRRSRTRFAAPVAAAAGPRRAASGVHRVPALRRDAPRRDAARNRALLRQHRPRGSQRARPAARPTTPSSTSAWRATTASRTSTAPPSARDAAGVSPRPARPGQHPHAHVGGRPHLAGAARQVGDGGAARHAAAAAAAERAGARRVGHGRAPAASTSSTRQRMEEHRKNPALHLVPPRDRSARPGARQLRRHRRLAHQGQRGAGGRRRRSLRRHADGRPGRPARRAARHARTWCCATSPRT